MNSAVQCLISPSVAKVRSIPILYVRTGLATLTTCLSLIQEAAAASARRALGMNKEKVAKDNIAYIDRRADIRVGRKIVRNIHSTSSALHINSVKCCEN